MRFNARRSGVGGHGAGGISRRRYGYLVNAQFYTHGNGAGKAARFERTGGVNAFVLDPKILNAQAAREPRGLQHRRHTFAQRNYIGRVTHRQHRSVSPHAGGAPSNLIAAPGRLGFFQIVQNQKGSTAFAQVVNLGCLAAFAADTAFQVSDGSHVEARMIATLRERL